MSKKRAPITVLLPVHRIDQYFWQSSASIEVQLTQSDQLLIVVNGPALQEIEMIRTRFLGKKEIEIHASLEHGIVAALNLGIAVARNEYIARMDADDLALPGRFDKQVEFLDRHKNIGVVGTQAEIICEHDLVLGRTFLPSRVRAHRPKPLSPKLIHPSVMFRKTVVEAAGGYREKYPHAEDHDLWTRVLKKNDIANLRRPYLRYRTHQNQVSTVNGQTQSSQTLAVILDDLSLRAVGVFWARIYCSYWEFLRVLLEEPLAPRLKISLRKPHLALWFLSKHFLPIIVTAFGKRRKCRQCESKLDPLFVKTGIGN